MLERSVLRNWSRKINNKMAFLLNLIGEITGDIKEQLYEGHLRFSKYYKNMFDIDILASFLTLKVAIINVLILTMDHLYVKGVALIITLQFPSARQSVLSSFSSLFGFPEPEFN